MVLQPSEPRITITGIERLSRPVSDLRVSGGIALFQDLHIISTVTRADANAHHTGINSYTSDSSHADVSNNKLCYLSSTNTSGWEASEGSVPYCRVRVVLMV